MSFSPRVCESRQSLQDVLSVGYLLVHFQWSWFSLLSDTFNLEKEVFAKKDFIL